MAISMIQSIASVLIQALVLDRLFKALGITQGSTGGVGGKLGKIFGFAEGGIARGPGTGTSDSILARISTGEAVIPARSVSANLGLINSLINGSFVSGYTPRYARGFSPAVAGVPTAQGPPIVNFLLTEDDLANASMTSQGGKVWLYHWNQFKNQLPK